MRKLILLLAALLLMALPAPAEERMVYQSDFSAGLDGWYARSTGSARVSRQAPNALRIEGRGADWHSPGRDFELIPGTAYTLSVQVRQEEADEAQLMVSVAHTRAGAESYENLARGTVKRGEWTTLRGQYTAGDYDRFVLYVETVGAPELSYEMRFFRIYAPEGAEQMENIREDTPAAPQPAGDLPSLKALYAEHFDFGTCVPGYLARNAETMAFIAEQFSIVTPENELKPDAVLDVAASKRLAAEDETAVAVHFDAARPLLDYAKAHGLKVHGHVLVWHSQTPEAFFHEGYDPGKPLVTRETMLVRLENYIRQVFEYMDANYPGLIVSWDVVNEAIDDGTDRLRESNWLKTVGEDFVQRAFGLARRYALSGTLLYYNDYNTAVPGKQNGIVRLLDSLITEGNIDGYGFQMHHEVRYPSMSAITSAVARVAGLGLRLRVSELDIGVNSATADEFSRQAAMYGEIMRLMLGYTGRVDAVQVWGLCDHQSWRAAKYPLLFDAQRSPKPAFWAVAEAAQ